MLVRVEPPEPILSTSNRGSDIRNDDNECSVKDTMKIMKPILTAAIVSTLMIASCFAGSKLKKNHVKIVDMKTGQVVLLEAPDNAQIFVAGPDGIEVGVLAGVSDDGNGILILPPSLIKGDDKQSPAPAPQNQSDRERLDHAGLVKISR